MASRKQSSDRHRMKLGDDSRSHGSYGGKPSAVFFFLKTVTISEPVEPVAALHRLQFDQDHMYSPCISLTTIPTQIFCLSAVEAWGVSHFGPLPLSSCSAPEPTGFKTQIFSDSKLRHEHSKCKVLLFPIWPIDDKVGHTGAMAALKAVSNWLPMYKWKSTRRRPEDGQRVLILWFQVVTPFSHISHHLKGRILSRVSPHSDYHCDQLGQPSCAPSRVYSGAIINGFVETIHPSFYNIIAISAFSACLLTLFTILFAFSTKKVRRSLAFRLNVCSLCIVLTMSILAGFTNGKAIVYPFNQVPRSVFVATVVFAFFPPLLYDSVLLIRLFVLYPLDETPPATLLRIFAFPFCIKCARAVVVTVGILEYVEAGKTTEALMQDETIVWFRNPYLIAELTMQIADNLYSVTLFLYNLRIRTKLIRSDGITISGCIRQAFYISIANFVFPLMFNILLLIFVTTRHSPNTGALLVFINNYITVMGVLCATLWSSRREWVRAYNESLSDGMLQCKVNLKRVSVTVREETCEMAVTGTRPHAVYPADSDSEAPRDSKQFAMKPKEDKYSAV